MVVGRSDDAAELGGAAAIVGLVLLLLVLLYKRRRDLFFFASAFFVLMVPYANIVYIGIWVADRYLYLTSGLLITAAVWGVTDLVRRKGDQSPFELDRTEFVKLEVSRGKGHRRITGLVLGAAAGAALGGLAGHASGERNSSF